MKKKKIAIVVNSLSNGGAERSNSMISKICEYLGHQVTIIAVNDLIDFEYGGDYISLGNQKTKNILKRKWTKFKHAYKIFKTSNFEVIIDARSRPTFYKVFVYKKIMYGNTPTISMVHNSDMSKSFPRIKFLGEYLYKNDYLITVSKKVKEIVNHNFKLTQVRTIKNAVSKKELEQLSNKEMFSLVDYEYILFFGRFENKSKNLLFLLEAYAKSVLPQKKIKLMLLGKGSDEIVLRNKVKELSLSSHVVFKEYTPNPMPYVKKALFTVMTSHYEGFPMTIIESLSIGTPIVTLNFISGPSEIIETGVNGILVIKNTTDDFADAINKMILDRIFYDGCKQNCKQSVRKFEMSQIAKKWDKLLSEI